MRVSNPQPAVLETAALPIELLAYITPVLLDNFRDNTSTHGTTAFTYRKPQPFFHRHRRNQLNHQAYIITRHHHLYTFRQENLSRHIRSPALKLRPISLEKRRMTPPFLFRQNIYF